MEINLSAVDEELKGIKVTRKGMRKADDYKTAEDDVAIAEAIAEIEEELEEEEFRENPSIWEVNLAIGNEESVEDDVKEKTPDDIAIEQAVLEVEKELAEEQFRENPSIWDLNSELPADSKPASIWEVNLKAIDEDLKEIKPKHRRVNNSKDARTVDDDVAISAAIAEVEEELEEEADKENPSIWEVNLDIGKEEVAEDDGKEKTPDDIAIEQAVMQIEKELAEERFRENPSIWDIAGADAATPAGDDDDRFKSPDELAIEKAIAQVEKELAEEQFRENPSIWDLNPELPGRKENASIWEVNLKAIDDDLRDIRPKHRRGASGNEAYTAEDDVAIAEAIHEVEHELQKEKNSENSVWFIGAALIGGLILSKAVSAWFTKST